MKNVLLLVHDDVGQEARLQTALDLRRAFDGLLTCVDVLMLPPITGSFEDAAVEASLISGELQRRYENRARIQSRLRINDVPWRWIEFNGDLAFCIERAADLADVIVVNRKLDRSLAPEMRSLAAELIVKSGRPIVAVPDGALAFNAGGRALVAWDGSAQAASALRAAVPLLRIASAVTIMEVDDGSAAIPAQEAVNYLALYEVAATIRRQAGQDDAASAILARATENRDDYIVMGGFGHSRLVEAVFGGVSRKMLTESPIPLFIAH